MKGSTSASGPDPSTTFIFKFRFPRIDSSKIASDIDFDSFAGLSSDFTDDDVVVGVDGGGDIIDFCSFFVAVVTLRFVATFELVLGGWDIVALNNR
jgi:hypothetical protein